MLWLFAIDALFGRFPASGVGIASRKRDEYMVLGKAAAPNAIGVSRH